MLSTFRSSGPVFQKFQALSTMTRWLRLVLIVAIAFGAVARFVYLDTKVYWYDETLTSLRTSGYLESEYKKAVSDRTVTVTQLQRFQHENAERDARSTIRALAIDDPQHPPLYYLLERSWDAFFGGSIAARRALGAFFSLLTIPALYWLGRELLPRASSFPLIAAALFAVSPFELEYSQQAREYTLWGFVTVLSSALFIRACRTDNRRTWIAYAVSIAVGMYSHSFFAFVIVAHALTVVYLLMTRQVTNWRPFFLSIVTAGCAYAPWAYNLEQHLDTVAQTNTWNAASLPAVVYLYKILFNVGAVFFDAEFANMLYSVMLLPIAAIVVWSLYVVSRSNERRLAVFISALFWAAVLPLLVPDLVLHQSRAAAGRYLLPAWIAIDLAVAYWIALELSQTGTRPRTAEVAATTLILLGAISWGVSARATSWYTASTDAPVLSIASALEERPKTLILTNDTVLALKLSNYLRPADRFVFTNSPTPEFVHAGGESRFLIEPSPALCKTIARYPHLSVSLAYAPPFTDSPMLHMPFMEAPGLRTVFSSLRNKMKSIHGDNGGAYRVWRVTNARFGQPAEKCR
jgi:uncharacterized membrane protein